MSGLYFCGNVWEKAETGEEVPCKAVRNQYQPGVFPGVLNLGMSIMGVDQNLQKVVKCGVLLAAVIFDVVSKRKSFIAK